MGNASPNAAASAESKTIFDFSVENIDGIPTSLESFRGKKAYIIVNVASK